MKPRGRKPNPLPPGRGDVRADALYPVAVLMRRLGIGRSSLASMRRRGLPVRSIGRRCAIVDGAELLAFLRAEWAAKSGHGRDDPTAPVECQGESAGTVPETVPGGLPR